MNKRRRKKHFLKQVKLGRVSLQDHFNWRFKQHFRHAVRALNKSESSLNFYERIKRYHGEWNPRISAVPVVFGELKENNTSI